MSKYSLGLLTIATNGYTKYLPNLVTSAASNLKNFNNYCHYIFTDDVEYARKLVFLFPETNFIITEIPNLKWPEATLLRYEIYCKFKNVFSSDILMHVDSDMYFLSNLEFEISPSEWEGGMAFVEHPGFFKTDLFDVRISALKSKVRLLWMGGHGAWETSKRSAAYTPRHRRKTYLCGGAWFGFQKDFLEFCEIAHQNVLKDSENGLVAKWHDESHLNCLVSSRTNPTILTSRYCYEPRYGKFLIDPILLAIDKSISLEQQLINLKDQYL